MSFESHVASPTQYHPRFNTEVYMIAFSVEGQGFKANAAQLCLHSEVIRLMLYGDEDGQASHSGNLGLNGEGSAENPIVIEGCSAGTFANFMSWLNHAAWETPGIDGVQGYLDVLHMTHMWAMKEGFYFSVNALDKIGLRAAHKVHLARRYGIPQWIPVAIRVLLALPLDDYTFEDHQHLGYAAFIEIAKGKELISRTRSRCAFIPPYPGPAALDFAPHCNKPDSCKRVWFESWGRDMMRRIHNPRTPLPLSHVVETLRSDMSHSGMHSACKAYVLNWIETSPTGFDKEENEILKVINAVSVGVMENVITGH